MKVALLFAVNPQSCPSCRLPLRAGVRHASTAECVAALSVEAAMLKNALSQRDRAPKDIRHEDIESPAVAPMLSLRPAGREHASS